MDSEIVMHSGGCHCKRVRWKVEAPTSVVAWQCNCTNCSMRVNTHFVVPSPKFELNEDSKQFLTTYTFGTHTAKHIFCKVCGITSFYIPRSNPDGVAITYRCVDPGTIKHVETRQFDGQNWECSFNQSGISSCSKIVQKGQNDHSSSHSDSEKTFAIVLGLLAGVAILIIFLTFLRRIYGHNGK